MEELRKVSSTVQTWDGTIEQLCRDTRNCVQKVERRDKKTMDVRPFANLLKCREAILGNAFLKKCKGVHRLPRSPWRKPRGIPEPRERGDPRHVFGTQQGWLPPEENHRPPRTRAQVDAPVSSLCRGCSSAHLHLLVSSRETKSTSARPHSATRKPK